MWILMSDERRPILYRFHCDVSFEINIITRLRADSQTHLTYVQLVITYYHYDSS
jgi:hypothetical protein